MHNHLIDKLALGNAILSGVALYPQLILLLTKQGSIEGVSFVSFFLILTNSLIWLWYGFHRRNHPLMISSFLNALASAGILILLLF